MLTLSKTLEYATKAMVKDFDGCATALRQRRHEDNTREGKSC